MQKQLRSRNSELENIFRYGSKNEWYPVFYRPNLLIHTTRVYWITREICNYLEKNSNINFSKDTALELAKFHDDSEILAGDIISVRKAEFTPEEKKDYDQKCLDAIEVLSHKYEKETHLNYKELLLQEHNKEGLEYHIVMYADKLDAHMEIAHEVFAGNSIFTTPLTRWGIDMNSFDHTRMKVTRLLEKLEEVFQTPLKNKTDLFSLEQNIDIHSLQKKGNPFTPESIQQNIPYIPYDFWKDLHFQHGNKREQEYLYTQRES